MSDISRTIETIVALKKGDTEMIVRSATGSGRWTAGIGNPSGAVLLGEADPEFEGAECATIEAALDSLLNIVLTYSGEVPDYRTDSERALAAMSDDEIDELNRQRRESARPGEIVSQIVRASRIMVCTIEAPALDSAPTPAGEI